MAGELYLGQVAVGKETTANTPVDATRKLYTQDAVFNAPREGRVHRFATGDRQTARALTNGPPLPEGSLSMPMSASEILELLLLGVKAAVTPTTPDTGVKLWTFVPGASLESATFDWYDGARGWEIAGARVNKLTIEGNVREANMVTAEILAQSMTQQTITAGLTDRLPDFIEGWETKLYVDAFAGTPGTTNITGTLISWSIEYDNQLQHKFFAGNSNVSGGVVAGEVLVTASLVFEAAASQALTEFNAWIATPVTKRLVRLEFGQNEVIASSYKKFVTVDLPGAWSAVDLGGDDAGTRTYELTLETLYDTTNAFQAQIRAQSARTAAWA